MRKLTPDGAKPEIALFAKGDHLFNQRTAALALAMGRLHTVFDNDGRDRLRKRAPAMWCCVASLNPAMDGGICTLLSN